MQETPEIRFLGLGLDVDGMGRDRVCNERP